MGKSDGDGTGGVRTAIRTQLWPLPLAGVVAAAVLGVALPELDAVVDDDLPARLSGYLFGGGPSAARTVLDAVASTLITVTALTFSLTVVTLQLASSQFSPRLLRTFSRDRFVHVTLALFLATFTYALTVLRTVRESDDAQAEFVPKLSVTVAYLLALASVLGLVLFLAHLARKIRVETMLHDVHRDATAMLKQLAAGAERHADGTPELPVPPADADALPVPKSGFLVHVDESALLDAALDARAVLKVDRWPGSSLVAGVPVGVAWPDRAAAFEGAALSRLRDRVAAAVTTGVERTEGQDLGYGLRQLTDVVVKALSPGINDPTTAVHALGHSAALLCELADCDPGPQLLRDKDGSVRVVLLRPGLGDLLDEAVTQPRRYGAADPLVLGRLFWLLREVAWSATTPVQRTAVTDQLARLRATAAEQDFDTTECRRLDELAVLVERALVGCWTPSGIP